jgi:hypothetical protein
MKTTLEIPDEVFRNAKAQAAKRGIPLREFITEAVQEKLKAPLEQDKPWMECFGQLRHLHDETVRINQIIDSEFETIDPEDWI